MGNGTACCKQSQVSLCKINKLMWIAENLISQLQSLTVSLCGEYIGYATHPSSTKLTKLHTCIFTNSWPQTASISKPQSLSIFYPWDFIIYTCSADRRDRRVYYVHHHTPPPPKCNCFLCLCIISLASQLPHSCMEFIRLKELIRDGALLNR